MFFCLVALFAVASADLGSLLSKFGGGGGGGGNNAQVVKVCVVFFCSLIGFNIIQFNSDRIAYEA